ncbi:MAG TPA: VOC family protein [Solirubrobacterales bacterium]|nr:VOC family protein [Solirubrobacterales bacterium]
MSQNGSIDPATSMGAVRLTVGDVDQARDFYRDAIGLTELEPANGTLRMGTADPADGAVVELVGDPDAPPRARGTSGLFHLAILVPSRPDLARALQRVAEAGWRLSGASDHLVSEALYTSDPEGNGIELYRDRAREEWPVRDGVLQMDTLPLDLDGVLGELRREDANAAMPAGTRIGHVHLNVSDLTAAEAFYSGALGFDVTVRGYPGALFVSAGGYHHHLGLNTWAGVGAPPPPPGSRGLREFEIVLPDGEAIAAEEDRLREAGFEPEHEDQRVRATDPSGNRVVLTAES